MISLQSELRYNSAVMGGALDGTSSTSGTPNHWQLKQLNFINENG